MQKFKDSTGHEWTLEITIGHIKPVEADTGVNLLKLDKPFELDADDWSSDGKPLPLIGRLQLDLELLFSVIYSLLLEQVKELELDEVGFGRRMAGDTHIHAEAAFWKELEDFFHRARRTDLIAAVRKSRAIVEEAMGRAAMKVDKISEKEEVDKIFGS